MSSDDNGGGPTLREGVRRGATATTGRGQRQHRRVALKTEVTISHSGSDHQGRTEDISEGGLLIATDAPLALGDQVCIVLPLPGAEPINVDAEVKRLRPGNPHAMVEAGVGVMFLAADELQKAVLRDFVMRRIRAILFRPGA